MGTGNWKPQEPTDSSFSARQTSKAVKIQKYLERILRLLLTIYSSFTLFSHFKRNLRAKAEMKGIWNSLSTLERIDSKAAKGGPDNRKNVPLPRTLVGTGEG